MRFGAYVMAWYHPCCDLLSTNATRVLWFCQPKRPTAWKGRGAEERASHLGEVVTDSGNGRESGRWYKSRRYHRLHRWLRRDLISSLLKYFNCKTERQCNWYTDSHLDMSLCRQYGYLSIWPYSPAFLLWGWLFVPYRNLHWSLSL